MPALTITDPQMSRLLDAIDDMGIPSLWPEGAKDAGEPFIECHHIAGGDVVYTVWHGVKTESFLEYAWQTADVYLDFLGDAALPLPDQIARRRKVRA